MRNVAIIAAAVVVLAGGFLIAKRGSDDEAAPASRAPAAVTPAATETTTTAAAPAVPVVQVVGGKPLGGVKDLPFRRGDRVRFTVASDVADEIHVHGFDLMEDVKAGGRVSFDFTANADGRYEVELEDRGTQIAELQIQP